MMSSNDYIIKESSPKDKKEFIKPTKLNTTKLNLTEEQKLEMVWVVYCTGLNHQEVNIPFWSQYCKSKRQG